MGAGGRKNVLAWAKVRNGGGVHMGAGGRKYVLMAAQVRTNVGEGALRWGRGCGEVREGDGRGRAICSQGYIRIYRNQSELIGGNRIGSDKF